jgi:hypothetical protein
MMNQEWAMGIDEMIESEAQAQAICMATGDFRRAFDAFANKRKPTFEGHDHDYGLACPDQPVNISTGRSSTKSTDPMSNSWTPSRHPAQ